VIRPDQDENHGPVGTGIRLAPSQPDATVFFQIGLSNSAAAGGQQQNESNEMSNDNVIDDGIPAAGGVVPTVATPALQELVQGEAVGANTGTKTDVAPGDTHGASATDTTTVNHAPGRAAAIEAAIDLEEDEVLDTVAADAAKLAAQAALDKAARITVSEGPASAPAAADTDAESASGAGDADLGPDGPLRTEDGKLIVYYRQGRLRTALRTAERALASTGRHFQRAGSIVVVQTDPATAESSVRALHPLALVLDLGLVTKWLRYDRRDGQWSEIDPPERMCNILIRAGSFEHLQALSGLARQPFLRLDGFICNTPGHDPETGQYGVFEKARFNIPEKPTREQAEQALQILNELLDEFAFGSEVDRSATLAAMLTAAVRSSLPLAPMFHVRAPQMASGKSYLCELLTAMATPRRNTPVGFPGGEEECRKLLMAQFMRAPAVIEFDNLTDDLRPHKSLCMALTSERLEGRILGKSQVTSVVTRALFLSSGNNVGPVGDMTRRCLTINLDPRCEVAAARSFRRHDLVGDVLRERERYVSAALTVVRAWVVAGCPLTACIPLAGYGAWAAWCRQPLMWLACPDPAASLFKAMSEDPDRATLLRFLDCWHEQFGGDAKMVRDVIRSTIVLRPGIEEFQEVMLEVAGEHGRINTRKLGRWIARHSGRTVNGLRLVKAPKSRNVENWRVESVTAVTSVPALAPASDMDGEVGIAA
jgi:hypothetical protein